MCGVNLEEGGGGCGVNGEEGEDVGLMGRRGRMWG